MTFSTFNEAAEAVSQFIRTGEGEFGELALALYSLQFENVPAYRDLCLARRVSHARAPLGRRVAGKLAVALIPLVALANDFYR